MFCDNCGGTTKVVNSRGRKKNNQVWRRRQCQSCQAVFTTVESIKHELTWMVNDKSGHYTPFMGDKLVLSLHKSLQHRETALSDAVALSSTVISKLPGKLHDGLIDSQDIVRIAQVALNRFDSAASVHYAANHTHP